MSRATLSMVGISGLLALLLIASLHAWLPPSTPPATVNVLTAERLISDIDDPIDLPNGAWVPATLPEGQTVQVSIGGLSVWYRLRLAPSPTWPRIALVVSNTRASAELWVDGVLYSDERWAGEVASRVRTPVMLVASGLALQRSQNVALLRLVGESAPPRLLAVRVGDAAAVEDWQRLNQAILNSFLKLMMVGLAVYGLAALLVAGRDRSKPEYAWFGATLVFWSLHCGWLLVDDHPMPTALWLPLSYITLIGFNACASIFLRRLSGHVASAAEPVALGSAAAMCLGLLICAQISIPAYLLTVRWLVNPLFLLAGAYHCTLVYGRVKIGSREAVSRAEIRRFAIPSTITFFVGIHDVLLAVGIIAAPRSLLQFTAPLVLIAFAGLLLQRYLRALDGSERFNEVLKRRIADREAQLAQEYCQRAAVEAASTAREERVLLVTSACSTLRKYIYSARDQVSVGASTEKVRRSIGDSLEQMRLVIDALDVSDVGALAALGNLRARLARRLEAAGIELDWKLDVTEDLPVLTEYETLRLLRVLSAGIRSLTDIVGTRRITVRLGVDTTDSKLCLELTAISWESKTSQTFGHAPMPDWEDAIAGLDATVLPLEGGYRVICRIGAGSGVAEALPST